MTIAAVMICHSGDSVSRHFIPARPDLNSLGGLVNSLRGPDDLLFFHTDIFEL